jgi:endogenous inhibitor of DNA gyrase (YacG/DUF329 family)
VLVRCPMCGRETEADEQPLADGVTIFCCERCATGVLRTFAYHEDRPGDTDERAAS